MKKFNEIQTKIIGYLNDGQCHSGNDLGTQFNVSRTAIWKHIKQLVDAGLPIERIPHRGYRLTNPMILLSETTIREQLKTKHFNDPIHLHLFASLDSTNRLLRELPRTHAIEVCCTEMQTAGRGRFGRQWYSPFGENIYCSSRWHFGCDLSRLSGLSLVVSLAILAMLNEIGIRDNVHVKWPNDILWYDKKLCGNLIEVLAESNSNAEVIIGIGLNVNSQSSSKAMKDDSSLPNKPWCSLFDITGDYIDRNTLIARLITHLNLYLHDFLRQGFTSFIPKWHQADYLKGKKITVSHLNGFLTGRAEGVNETGQLIIIDEIGATHCLSSGDTSLHAGGNIKE